VLLLLLLPPFLLLPPLLLLPFAQQQLMLRDEGSRTHGTMITQHCLVRRQRKWMRRVLGGAIP
jgi:hypothetical protein